MSSRLRGLRGDAALLRALTADDLPALHGFINDPDVVRLSNLYRPVSSAQQEAWWRSISLDPNACWFGIDDIRTDPPALVGTACLVDIEPVARQAELRIRIGDPKAWGQGLGGNACRLLVAFGFDDLNLERIWLRLSAHNARAQHVYEKIGFVVEGRLRGHAFVNGGRQDVILMGLLRDEWRRPP